MLKPDNCIVVFGVPAFQAGWEMNAFANNIRFFVNVVERRRCLLRSREPCGCSGTFAGDQVRPGKQ